MSSRSVSMYEVRIPIEAVKKMSDEDRFAYYLLGHAFNELMSLQKIVGFALPKHDDSRPERVRPEHAQAMLLFRLACGKIWETSQVIRQDKQVSAILRNVILPKMADGFGRLKALNKAINDAPWLSPLRSGMGFHFPSYEKWKEYITPDDSWVDDSVFLGAHSGNTFYDGADSVAQSWMFGQYGLSDVRDAVDPLISQMIDLLREMNTFLEDVLGTLIVEIILGSHVERRLVGKVLGPQHDRVFIPFWTAMLSEKSSIKKF